MNIVGYVRLSRDEEGKNFSSIESQQRIIIECAKEYYDEEISNFYIDDNVSGYTFDRPGLNQMKKDFDKIDVVIAKDLSRLGRHNAKVLLLIEEIQSLNKRLLLPEEGKGFDSLDEDDDIIGITTWYNQRYIKDISKKIRSSIKSKQKNGTHIIRASLGYMKNPADKHNLIINEEESWIIKLIFEKYLEGLGSRKIANYLTQKSTPTPSQLSRLKSENLNKVYKGIVSDVWTAPLINRIITNDIYTGVLRLGKTKKMAIKGKSVPIDKSAQFYFENNHAAIISKEDFELAQRMNIKRKKSFSKGGKKNIYLFTGLMYCEDCKKPIIGHTSRHGVIEYVCTTYHNRGKSCCDSHRITESRILEILIKHLKNILTVYNDVIKNTKINKTVSNYDSLIKKLNKNIINNQNELQNILMQKIRDISKQDNEEYRLITEQTYAVLENKNKDQLIKFNNQIDELRNMSNENIIKKLKDAIDIYEKIISTSSYTQKQMNLIIDNIFIDKDRTLTIELNDDFDKLSHLENSMSAIF